MEEKERIYWLDIARAFFIIAIVLGHIFDTGYLRNWLFSFHVPAFFFLSGYCFKYTKNMSRYLLKKVQTIVVPYFVFSLFSIIIFSIASRIVPRIETVLECDLITNLGTMFFGNSKPDVMKYNSPLWFLPCFFVVSVLGYFVERIVRRYSQKVRYVTIIVCVLLGILVSNAEEVILPWHFETAVSMMVWYLLGVTFKESKSLVKKIEKFSSNKIRAILLSLLLILIGVGISILNTRTVGVRNDHYGMISCYYSGAVFGISGFMLISIIICNNRFLEYIGRNSLVILVLHKFPILVFQEMIPVTAKLLGMPDTIGGIICGMLTLGIVIPFTLMAGVLIRKICPWSLGVKKEK